MEDDRLGLPLLFLPMEIELRSGAQRAGTMKLLINSTNLSTWFTLVVQLPSSYEEWGYDYLLRNKSTSRPRPMDRWQASSKFYSKDVQVLT